MAFGLFKKKETYADKVFYNAHVYTMDSGLPWTEAVAVKDGRILAVGNFEEMDVIIDDDTEIIDLGEKYMLPGFIDIHHSPVMKMMRDMGQDEDEEAFYDEPDEDTMPEEPSDEDEFDELDDETEYYVDNSEFTEKVAQTMEALSDHGFTTVLDIRTPHNIENEFTDSLIELYTEGGLRQRFFGSLYIDKPVPGRLAKEVLSMRRTKCTELGDMIKNEFLYVLLDSGEDRVIPQDDLNSILEECADRGFSFYIEAVEREDMLEAYQAVEHVRSKGYRNCIIIATDEELTDEEDAELSASGTVYLIWRSDVMGGSFFEGKITDIEDAIEHLTMGSAEMLGMEEKLGSIEKGKYADFAVFSENPLETRPGELSKLFCDMTVLEGEIVSDVEAENEEYMLNMIMYSR